MVCRQDDFDIPPMWIAHSCKQNSSKAAEPGASQSTLACCPFQLLPDKMQLSHCCADKFLACAATASNCPLQHVPQLQIPGAMLPPW